MSTPAPGLVDPPDAPAAGADLRLARQRLRWSLEEAAANLRIRVTYLAALEEGRLGLLPGNAYALGFLRTYATALGLDPEEMRRRFKSEAAVVRRQTELAFPAPAPERGLPAGALILVALVLVTGAYAGWYRLSGEGRLPAETMTAIPERLASLAEQAVKTPPPLAHPVPAPHPVALALPAEPPPLPYAPKSAAASPIQPPITLPTTDPVADPDPAPPQAAALPADQSRFTIRATADAWILIKDRGGPVLLNRTLKTGETWAVPDKANLAMTTGNAGGTELLLDGVAISPLGGPGAVRRDIPLDPALVKEGKLLAGAPPGPASRIQQ